MEWVDIVAGSFGITFFAALLVNNFSRAILSSVFRRPLKTDVISRPQVMAYMPPAVVEKLQQLRDSVPEARIRSYKAEAEALVALADLHMRQSNLVQAEQEVLEALARSREELKRLAAELQTEVTREATE